MFYGAAVWDPWLILAQIITVQCLFYLSFGLLLYLFLGESGAGAMQVPVAEIFLHSCDHQADARKAHE